VLFSYFYSLYLAYFPTGYYLYGSLAAALFLMLWLYTCMNILLVGAEINKLIFRKRKSREE
ncbi:MAG: YhjD/YihY/BrkB family envelope integrity protein, partial [Clostridia bacterium]|nr:YhjD/YihY/BrkB family envelope integrity protein [Clostridia bacterium]